MGSRKNASRRADSSQSHPSRSLFRICTAMTSTLELGKLLDLILRLTMEELHAQQGSILLFDESSDQLKMLAARGMPREITERGYIPRKGSIAEWVIEHNEPLLLKDVENDPRFTSIAKGRRIHSSMCVPLRAKGRVIGTINITRTHREEFTQRDLETLVILATQAAVSIENARLYEKSLEAERMATIGRTVAAISHCTKNMLMGLKGGAAIIEMGCEQKNWDLVRQGWDMVKRNTDRIALMVLDMLEYSKERSPARSVIETSRLFEDVISGVSYLAQQLGIRLAYRVENGCEAIYADYDQLYRALLNLATNAVDAVRESGIEDGVVELKAECVGGDSPVVRRCMPRAQGRFYLLHVRDNGPGIPPEDLASIFEPFFSRKGSKGTGLGLAVTRKIAREHGGDVTVESQLGRGTVFSLVLPAIEPPEGDSARTA